MLEETSMQICYVFQFHKFFDGLIGYVTLRSMKADILTAENKLRFPSGMIDMFRKYPDKTVTQLNSNETKVLNLPINLKD